MRLLKSFVIISAVFVCSAFESFHHGWANYDQNTTLDYKGVVQELVYENPHATAKVKDKKKVWTVILAPISRMEARGVTAAMIKKGSTIQVVGYPHKEIKDENAGGENFCGREKV